MINGRIHHDRTHCPVRSVLPACVSDPGVREPVNTRFSDKSFCQNVDEKKKQDGGSQRPGTGVERWGSAGTKFQCGKLRHFRRRVVGAAAQHCGCVLGATELSTFKAITWPFYPNTTHTTEKAEPPLTSAASGRRAHRARPADPLTPFSAGHGGPGAPL